MLEGHGWRWSKGKDWLRSRGASPVSYRHNFLVHNISISFTWLCILSGLMVWAETVSDFILIKGHDYSGIRRHDVETTLFITKLFKMVGISSMKAM